MNIDTLIEDFNQSDYHNIELIFQNVDNFFNFVESRGKLTKLGLYPLWFSLSDYEEFKFNNYCLRILEQSGISYFQEYVYGVKVFGDESYFEIYNDSLKNLIEFFPHEPESSFIKSLYKDEESLDNGSINYFYDVYKNLNRENKNYFRNFILENFSDVNLELDDFIINAGEIQNYLTQDEKTFNILDNIDEILRNETIFTAVIFTDDFVELESLLFNLYNESYTLARKHKGENLILNSLSNIFYPETYSNQGSHYLKIKDFYSILENYFNCMSDYRESIYNDSTFESLIWGLIQYECFPEPEFDPEEPDSKDISIELNNLFNYWF